MRRFIICLLLIGFAGSPVLACCMLPATYKGSIRQNDHEAVIIHHGGREELVLRIDYKITGKTMPDRFAWVITVPNEPDNYALADAKLFEEMFELSKKLRQPIKKKFGGGFGAGGAGGFGGVELGKQVTVGPYDIQPVRGVGANALTGLNAWLKAKGFPTEDPKHMQYFVDHQFTFLCVKIAPPKGKPAVGAGGKLPPLHLSFASAKPYYPLRFSSRQGVFGVNLHVLTRRTLNYRKSARVLRQINWTNQRDKRNARLYKQNMPDTLQKVFAKTRFKKDKKVWYYNCIRADQVNRDNAIAKWTTDVFLNGLPRKPRARVGLREPEGNVPRFTSNESVPDAE